MTDHIKNRRGVLLTLLLVTIAALVLAACGSSSGGSSTASEEGSTAAEEGTTASEGGEGGGGTSVGLVLSGPTNDDGYYEQTATGMEEAAAKVGDELKVVENVGFEPNDQINAAKNLILQGAELVVMDGTMGNAAAAVAEQNPEVEVVIHQAPPPAELPNLHAYIAQQGITSYIIGSLAASLSSSKKVGFIAGLDDIPTGEAFSGFKLGVEAQDPSVSVEKSVVGSYSDPAKAKQATAAQLSNGVDEVYGFVDAGLLGVAGAVDESGDEAGVYASSVSRCDVSEAVVASALADHGQIMLDILESYAAEELVEGVQFYGVEDPKMQRVELCPGWDTPENEKLVEQVTAEINEGKVKLPKSVTGA
ncbi:MAG: BMP family ABC transporter substrate-binding protein [Solirubrobacterales bacterium]